MAKAVVRGDPLARSIMLLLLCSLSWLSFTSGVLVTNLNNDIDYYIENLINPAIAFFTYDVINLPDIDGSNFTLSGGSLTVKPLIRFGDSVLMIKDNRMFFNASIGLQRVEAVYSVKISLYDVITLHYTLEASITGISQGADFLIVHQDGQSCAATITNARLSFENIHLQLHGFSSFIFNILSKSMLEKDEYKSKIIDYVNSKTDLFFIHFNKHLVFNCYKMFTS